jgi:hypothetical protein
MTKLFGSRPIRKQRELKKCQLPAAILEVVGKYRIKLAWLFCQLISAWSSNESYCEAPEALDNCLHPVALIMRIQ